MIRRAVLRFFAGAVLASLAHSAAAQDPQPHEIISVLRHHDWVSGLLDLPDTRIGRAATADTLDEPALIALDTSAGECGVWRMVVLVPGERMEGAPAEAYGMRVWVDGDLVGEGRLETVSVPGSGRLRLEWREPVPDHALPASLRSGGSMRLALLAPEGEPLLSFRFSLAGAAESLERAAALCAGEVPDEPFFPYASS